MSADNWGVCPNCKKLQQEKRAKLLAKIDKARADKDFDTFAALTEQAITEPEDAEPERTLREDYEIFMNTDADDATGAEFYISYSAGCYKCNWQFKFKHTDTNVFKKELDRNRKG